jgi:hypothetical protein
MSKIKCSTAHETRRRIESVLAGLGNPSHKQMLQTWLKHWWGEVVYDISAVMETVTDDISYRWHGTDQIGDGVCEDSSEFARKLYQSMFDAQLMPGGPFDGERWAFSNWGLMMEALFTSVFPGSMLKGSSAQLDPNGLYLVQWRMAVSHPFNPETALMAGEIMYAGAPLHIERTDRAMIRRLLGRE